VPSGRQLREYLTFHRLPGAIPELDGVRAIAILLVLGRHASRPFDRPDQAFLQIGSWPAGSLLINGWTGVDLFFVLSGLLITHHILRRFAGGFDRRKVGRYLAKRALRIVPAYYGFLAVVVLGLLPFYRPAGPGLGRRTLYHLLFLQDYLGSDIVVAFWSLGVEEKFYLLAPLLIVPIAAWRAPRRYLLLLFLFLLPIPLRYATFLAAGGPIDYGRYFTELRSPFHVSFDGLVAGCAIAFVVRSGPTRAWLESRARWLLGLGLGATLLLLAAAPLVERVSPLEGALVGTLVSLAFGLSVLGLLGRQGPLNRWLSARWMLFFSKISYSLYLVHMVFMDVTLQGLERLPGFGGWGVNRQFALYLPVFCVVSIAGALVLHYAIERPFLILKDRT
jgi:peptidoglycan/LPS O-acetylase OafA/YrhL